jgi:hypothetical protein
MNRTVARCIADGDGQCRQSLPYLPILRFVHSLSGKVKIMRMLTVGRLCFLGAVGLAASVLSLSGCPANERVTKPAATEAHGGPAAKAPAGPVAKQEKKEEPPPSSPAKKESAEEQVTEVIEQAAKKPRDLGPPLVDNPENLKRLHPEQPVWIDMKNRQVVLQGEVCSAGYPLEFFATYPNRSYESVLSVNVQPSVVHAGLLAVGAKPGHPVRFQPEFTPPKGTEVAIEVRWKDAQGKVQSSPAQKWIRNIKTKKALDTNWVFAGSMFVMDQEGTRSYAADSGELICVLNLQSAMLDLPVRSDSAMESRVFEAFTERLPPQNTPTTVIFKPVLALQPPPQLPPAAPPATKTAAAPPSPQQAEKQAAAVVSAWLALVDAGQYSQAWEKAAGPLKAAKTRKEFIKALGTARKPLGAATARQLESQQFATTSPGAPSGQYFDLQYKTSFAKRKAAVETITAMLDKDKKWRVSAYHVK